MNTQNEISVLADQALDAVVGGRMKTGMDPKPLPGGSVHAGNQFDANVEAGILVTIGVWAITVAAFL